MKKFFLLLFILLIPINVYGYSDYIYRGGNTLGIEVNCDGVLVVGFYQIDGKYNKANPTLKIGDYITKVNDIEVHSLNELSNAIEKFTDDKKVSLTYRRDGKENKTVLDLIYNDNIYKTGLYVKDSVVGIGTLTYIDPSSLIYGALGHEIIEGNTGKLVEVSTGKIFRNKIVSIDKSSVGHAGSKNAKYFYNNNYGNINKNTIKGIFGQYNTEIQNMELLKVGTSEDIKIGEAFIYTVLNGEEVEEFKIRITNINPTSNTKNITFEIIDKDLLEQTGGVIQGMSGSPIVQDNKIVGVVTHVIVDNPYTGYGLFITKMLEEGER